MKSCYCINCGYKNKSKDKYCQHCNKKLKPKDHSIRNYLFAEFRNDLKDNAITSLVDKVIYFIKKHLYGIIISITIVASVTGNIIINNINDEHITDTKPTLNSSIKTYQNSEALMTEFEKAYLDKDINSLYTLMYDNNYIKASKQLDLYPSKNGLIQDIDIFTFSTPRILYSETNIAESNIEAYGQSAVKLKNAGYELYHYNLTLVYYVDSATYGGKIEATFFDYDFFIVNVDGNFYIADIVYFNDPERLEYFYDMKGDVSKYGL